MGSKSERKPCLTHLHAQSVINVICPSPMWSSLLLIPRTLPFMPVLPKLLWSKIWPKDRNFRITWWARGKQPHHYAQGSHRNSTTNASSKECFPPLNVCWIYGASSIPINCEYVGDEVNITPTTFTTRDLYMVFKIVWTLKFRELFEILNGGRGRQPFTYNVQRLLFP